MDLEDVFGPGEVDFGYEAFFGPFKVDFWAKRPFLDQVR